MGKKEVFLRPSGLTGGLRVSFMCWIHPYRPPGSINCLLQWSSVPQCGTSFSRQRLIERNYGFDFVVFYLYASHIRHADVLFLRILFSIFSWYKLKLKNVFFFCRRCHHSLLKRTAVTGETCPAGIRSNMLYSVSTPSLPASPPRVQVVTGNTKCNLFDGI